MTRTQNLRCLIYALYQATGALEAMFPERSFAVDGELADRLAESMAECCYGVRLQATEEDSEATNDLLVKAAQGGRIWLRDCPPRLLVLRLYKNGLFEEVYNGPGELVRDSISPAARRNRDGASAVALTLLRELMRDVPSAQRLPRAPALEPAAQGNPAPG